MTYQRPMPAIGDIVVNYQPPDGFAIERWTSERAWEQVAHEKAHLAALATARRLANEAGAKAWTYELDDLYVQIV